MWHPIGKPPAGNCKVCGMLHFNKTNRIFSPCSLKQKKPKQSFSFYIPDALLRRYPYLVHELQKRFLDVCVAVFVKLHF
jgi:hypothetical protein